MSYKRRYKNDETKIYFSNVCGVIDGKKATAGDVWMFNHVRYAWSSGKFIGATWAPGGNYLTPANFGYLYFMKDKVISSETVIKVLEAAAPVPWMLPLEDKILLHPQGGKMEFTTPDAMAAARRASLRRVIGQAKNAAQNDGAALKQLGKIDAISATLSYNTPVEALDVIDKMTALQQQAAQIYWQQQIDHLIDKAAAMPQKLKVQKYF
jgi:hypothetical protein